MIAQIRSAQIGSAGEFADGLIGWLHGTDSLESEAAASILAETILMHRAWLKSKFKK